jgi:hypothetical protein
MATQYIKFKRSSIPGKRPSNSQMELGELALNTNDGRIFTKKENVGVGTTITLLNVWTENVGGGAYYNDGAVGIGTTNPTSVLEVYTNDGDIKLGDITALPTTDVGVSFSGLGTYTSAIFTELNGEILSYGINTPQIQNPRNTGRVGGIFRLDTRLPGGLGDSSCFVIKYAPVGFGTTAGGLASGIKNGIIISLQDSQTYLVPDEGNVLVGLKTDTGTLNQKLQVLGGAYINDNIGIGTTTPTSRLHIIGDALVTGVVTATAFNGNINAEIGTITNLSGTNVSYNGIGTVGSLNIGSTQVISSARELQNIASLDATTTATIETAIANAPNTFTDLQVTGVSTFTNGPVLIGSGTSTGTALQPLQVTGGVYVSGNLGIGTTNPISRLTVQGDVLVTGVVTATAFNGNINAGVGTITNLNLTNLNVSGVTTTALLNVGTGGTIITTTSNGSIGIGTTNPLGPLQIGYAGTHTSFIIDTNGNLGLGTITPTSTITEGVAHRTLHFYSPNSRQVSLRLDNGNTGGNAWLLQSSGGLAGNGQGKFSIYDKNNDAIRFTVDSLGNIGIGTTNPTSKLTVQGDVLVSGVITSTDYNSASDINLKENIQPIENPIDKVLQINGVSFDWKETGRSSMGVIAQEVERVLPELVSGVDSKTVNYNGLIGLLIEVVKELNNEIIDLKAQINNNIRDENL